jgi:plastocyanin
VTTSLHANAGRPLRPAFGFLLMLVLLVACGQPGPSVEPASRVATDQVDLPQSYKFVPADIVVDVGTTVTWTNHDQFTHSVRFADGGEAPLMMKPGESVQHTFDAPGMYAFDCSLHPTDMQGTVLVEAAPG